MQELISVVYLLLPILFGALLHGFFVKNNWMPLLYKPLDFGTTFRGKPLFGPNKTFRGPIALGIGSSLFMAFQAGYLHSFDAIRAIELLNYETINPWIVGFFIGVGSMLGELPNSFMKRQLGYGSGEAPQGRYKFLFFILDQIDLLMGVWLVLAFVMPIKFSHVFYSILIVYFSHQLTTYIGYKTGLRKTAR